MKKRKFRWWLWPLLLIPGMTIGFAMVCAKVILSGTLPESALHGAALGAVGVTAAAVSWVTAAKAPEKRFLCGLAAALLYGLLLWCGNLLFFGKGYGNAAILCAVISATGFLGSLMGAKKRKKRA